MVRWNGFAELAFTESAWLAFARAVELAETDAHERHPEAWIIRDRRITFSAEAESGRAVVEGMKRFLGLLILQAESGEAVIETAPPSERWVRRADASSGSQDLVADPEDEAPHSRTIRASRV